MARTHRHRHVQGFSMIEMLVVLLIAALLCILSFTGFSRVKDSALIAQCAGNMRAIGMGALLYSAENKGFVAYYSHYPWENGVQVSDPRVWFQTNQWMHTYGAGGDRKLSLKLMRCPADPVVKTTTQPDYYSYLANTLIMPGRNKDGLAGTPPKIGGIRYEPRVIQDGTRIAMVEGDYNRPYQVQNGAASFAFGDAEGYSRIGDYHRGGTNALFVDGSVRWYKKADAYVPELMYPNVP